MSGRSVASSVAMPLRSKACHHRAAGIPARRYHDARAGAGTLQPGDHGWILPRLRMGCDPGVMNLFPELGPVENGPVPEEGTIAANERRARLPPMRGGARLPPMGRSRTSRRSNGDGTQRLPGEWIHPIAGTSLERIKHEARANKTRGTSESGPKHLAIFSYNCTEN